LGYSGNTDVEEAPDHGTDNEYDQTDIKVGHQWFQ
jgi:hypothetical protein